MRRWGGLVLAMILGSAPMVWASSKAAPHEAVTAIWGSETATTQQTDNVLLTPASGNAIALMGCTLAGGGTNSSLSIELESANVDVIAPQFVSTNPIVIGNGPTPIWVGTADATLDWSTNAPPAAGHGVANITCSGYQFRP